MTVKTPPTRGPGVISKALHALVSQIPGSTEPPSQDPRERAHALGKTAALKAAAVSGSFTLPPGPFGMATVLPDLLAVWRIQQQLVADIAAAFGKTEALTTETMAICLFKHGGAALTKYLYLRERDEVLVQRIANRTLLQLLEKIAVRMTQRAAAKSLSRWIPVLGVLGAGAYAYYDTTHVAANAIELFSQKVRFNDEPDQASVAASAEPRKRRTASRSGERKKAKPKGRSSTRRSRATEK
jgi:hypothetical protein